MTRQHRLLHKRKFIKQEGNSEPLFTNPQPPHLIEEVRDESSQIAIILGETSNKHLKQD